MNKPGINTKQSNKLKVWLIGHRAGALRSGPNAMKMNKEIIILYQNIHIILKTVKLLCMIPAKQELRKMIVTNFTSSTFLLD